MASEDHREIVAAWMIHNGYATGHGDTIEGLLDELKEQIVEKYGQICADAIPESGLYKDHCYLPTARKACINATGDHHMWQRSNILTKREQFAGFALIGLAGEIDKYANIGDMKLDIDALADMMMGKSD